MENNNIVKEELVKNDKDLTSEYILEEVITKAIQIPGVKVNRNDFLTEEFSSKSNILEKIIKEGPIEAGITREEINNIANKLIIKRTSQSSLASFVTGIPGGLAMTATIPADILQFFGMSLRLAQELSYLYGADDLWNNGEINDEKVKNQLILYCGVMFGVSGAISGVRVISAQVAKTALKKIPQKALTKTFWYPIIKKICSLVGYTLTKKTLASGISKVIPVIGGVVSGTINFASMMPMAKKLNETLDKAVFDYSEEEFNKDIEIIECENGAVSKEEEENFMNKFNKNFNKTKENISNLISKINKKESNEDPLEEIKKYKELLDLGIISQEEFDKKKKELLNL